MCCGREEKESGAPFCVVEVKRGRGIRTSFKKVCGVVCGITSRRKQKEACVI